MAHVGVFHLAHEDRVSVFPTLSQVYGVHVVKAAFYLGDNGASAMGIIGWISLISSDICQSNVHVIEVNAPAVFGNEALPDKVLAIGVELKRPHPHPFPSATHEHDADDEQHRKG